MLSPSQPPSTVAGIVFQHLTVFPEVWIQRLGCGQLTLALCAPPAQSLPPAPLCHLEEGGAETGTRRLLSSADTPIAGAASWHLKPNNRAEALRVHLRAAAAPLCTEYPWLWGGSPPLETSPRNRVFQETLSPDRRSSSARLSRHAAASATNVMGFLNFLKIFLKEIYSKAQDRLHPT